MTFNTEDAHWGFDVKLKREMTSSIPFWDQPELEKGGVEVPTVVKNDEEIAKFTVSRVGMRRHVHSRS